MIEKTQRGERAVDIYSRLLTERIVYIGTEIDDGVANVVIAQLLHLESENPDAPIDLYLNSPGGSMTSMLAIYDAMEFIRPEVGTKCVGQAASTAAVLLAAGAPGQRMVLPRARVVLHQPSAAARARCRTSRCREGDRPARVEMEEILARTRAGPSSRSARTPSATWCCPRPRRWRTGSWTGSWTAGRKPPT